MDVQEARDALDAAQRSQFAARRPMLRRWQPPLTALAMAAGLGVLGVAPYTTWWRIGAAAAAVVFAGGGMLALLTTRSRQGVRGVRGAARRELTVLAICGISVLIGALNAAPAMRWIYVLLGAFVGVFTWATLHKQVRR